MGDENDNRGRFDRPRLAAFAKPRHWAVSVEELHALGFTERQIRYATDTSFLHRHHHGVYAVGRSQLSFEGNCRAAWLACGPQSAISHISAAREWNFRQSTGRIHISIPRHRAGHRGLIVHRPLSLPQDDVVERGGYAATSVARTILDMAAAESPDTVAKWMHAADVAGVLDLREVWACCERLQHHRGRRIVEAALAVEVLPTRSGLEQAFLPIVRAAGLPTPEVNAWLSSGERLEEVDFAWRDLGLIVEADSIKYHSSEWRKRRDREKAARFEAVGWTVWRVPELAITLNASGVAAELRAFAADLGR